ncbi:hypothetical protein PVAP13_6NG360450 [Panicum virgatum]|uniref:Uncharacterized protein n=1 Tax=Panicum virgatum TaxID=38727 RepID=A0A8T0R6E7_PANVG|nr:hypothetical protein PVAP13_6NG360450 [Panicum virgatum]
MQSRALRRGRSGLGLGERLAQLGGSRRAGWRRSQARRIGRGWTRGCPGAPDALVERCGSFAVSGDRRKQPPIHLRSTRITRWRRRRERVGRKAGEETALAYQCDFSLFLSRTGI